jgi:hypothetical protein
MPLKSATFDKVKLMPLTKRQNVTMLHSVESPLDGVFGNHRSHMTGVVMAGPVKRGPGTTWMDTPMIWQLSSRHLI